ncbi:hypothetical protein JKL49_20785 [Phenylobacterium sp. 20VBR1]|uniref:Surface-adhesin protein E-like domain-containing protein n=1 Tax=Phenylobacterium glaciei TaxID=2803784 RepID=A0A941HYX5_9CAUL|nr:surface-adhesin E family protein [Phenylobacterium glaciei]MBR7621840.1 hypothetical protein [Phenylobacterium glaciei]QQZ50342.1 hypothetical protein JKL49_01015 [Phenylobacterium glaciei]
MRRLIVLGLSGLSLAAGAAQAQAWTPLTATGPETIFYDPATVTRANGVVTAVMRAEFNPPQASGSVMVSAMVEKMSINCAANVYSDLGNIAYDATGAVLWNNPASGPAKPITAGSGAIAIQAKVCP